MQNFNEKWNVFFSKIGWKILGRCAKNFLRGLLNCFLHVQRNIFEQNIFLKKKIVSFFWTLNKTITLGLSKLHFTSPWDPLEFLKNLTMITPSWQNTEKKVENQTTEGNNSVHDILCRKTTSLPDTSTDMIGNSEVELFPVV